MQPAFKKTVTVFMTGMALGGLMGISIKYPLKASEYAEAEKLCVNHLGVSKVKVGLAGKIYTVICTKDAKQFTLK